MCVNRLMALLWAPAGSLQMDSAASPLAEPGAVAPSADGADRAALKTDARRGAERSHSCNEAAGKPRARERAETHKSNQKKVPALSAPRGRAWVVGFWCPSARALQATRRNGA
jgi:hypothetical protein